MTNRTRRTKEIEGEIEQLREDAENARFNMEQFGLDSYTPSRLHQWKEAFEEGLDKVREYSQEYLVNANNVSMTGVNARRRIIGCIDCLTQEIISRYEIRGERK